MRPYATPHILPTELGVAGCTNLPDHSLIRTFQSSATSLEVLDLSFCLQITDSLLVVLAQICHKLRRLKLRGCRQISDTSILAIANGCSDLMLLDLMRFDLHYKINDVSLLALAEHCHLLQTLILSGCDMITDVGMNWLSSGCVAITYLDVSDCCKLSDLSMRSIGEGLVQLQHLALKHCSRISDVGLRHLARGCPELRFIDFSGCTLLRDYSLPSSSGSSNSSSAPWTSKACSPKSPVFALEMELSLIGIASLAYHCGLLEHIDLSNCTQIADTSLYQLARGCRRISFLSLARCSQVTNNGIIAILCYCRHLKSLVLSDCEQVTDHAFHKLGHQVLTMGDGADPAASLSSPQKHNVLGTDTSTAAASSSSANSSTTVQPVGASLNTLKLRNCVLLTDRAIKYITRGCLELKELDLTGCIQLTDLGIMAISESSLARTLRYIWLCGLPKITATGVSWIAETCPNLLLLDLSSCKIRSFSLQALADKWKFTEFKKKHKFRGFLPKHRAEDRLFLEEYGACWRAAVRIQCLFRARVARRMAQQKREERLMNWAVTRMQSFFRGRQARKYAILCRMQRNTEEDAARRIQGLFRQRQARRLAAQMRIDRQWREEDQAARKLQAAWRRKRLKDRLQVRELKRIAELEKIRIAATKLQRCWRGKSARNRMKLLRAAKMALDKAQTDAAIKLQAQFRRRHARNKLNQRREEKRLEDIERDHAASKIQNLVRSFLARKFLAKIRAEYMLQSQAARRIQNHWRFAKRSFQGRVMRMMYSMQQEYQAATKLQAAWKRKKGRDCASILRLVREAEQARRTQAAIMVQKCFRGKKARDTRKQAQQLALERVWKEVKLRNDSATRIQARFRGIRARKLIKKIRLDRKHRWKQIVNREDSSVFYYNKDTGEVRFRVPQDVLDLLPKPKCNDCTTEFATVECRDCVEAFCKKCWDSIHAGGKRKSHGFRVLYDYFEKRIDYGDGEFPSKWPTEIEQDEMNGWILRVRPYRDPVETRGNWEKYVDDDTKREFYYNRITKEALYLAPEPYRPGYQPKASELESTVTSTSITASTAYGGGESFSNAWTKYLDAASGQYYYYNSVTMESTFSRPTGYISPRQGSFVQSQQRLQQTQGVLTMGFNNWMQFLDASTGRVYYFNSQTQESTYTRPPDFVTPRELNAGDQAPDSVSSEWVKYYDQSTGYEYFYNTRTAESTYTRPFDYVSPRDPAGQAVATNGQYYETTSPSYY